MLANCLQKVSKRYRIHKISRIIIQNIVTQNLIRHNIFLWVKDGVDTKALPLVIELMKYGYEHCDVVILEGIMYDGVV